MSGIISFLLINYWFINFNNNKSAFKALILNKIGDLFFIVFISLYFFNNKNLNLFNQFYFYSSFYLLFLFLAAIAKSAQLFFHVWLGDAMAGPTPVSALLHAATMVTAGIFLLIRFNIYSYNSYIIYISLFTILLGGIAAINQYDIKKIIAYSTISQLGYMLYSLGINNNDLALFHLFIHGFFKALLFLSAGLIIHNYYNEQDIRKLGNLLFYSPLSYLFFLFGTLSIISFPYLSGYYSKELIIYNSYFNNFFILSLLYLGVFFTIIYSFNLLYNIFIKNILIFPFKESFPSSFYFLFIPLLSGSLFFGFFFYDFFFSLSFQSLFLLNYIPNILHIIPLIFISFSFFIIYFINNKYPNRFHIIFNRRFFIDSLYNYFSFFFLYFSSFYFYKFLDKGLLEFFGPVNLYRFLFNIKFTNDILFHIFFFLFFFFFFFSSFYFFFSF